MSTRSQWLRNKEQHDQREFGRQAAVAVKDSDTSWIPEFVAASQGTSGHFGVNSIIALMLSEFPEIREMRLRKLSSMGILHMRALRDRNGNFIEYQWCLTRLRRR